eukprot:TRINITY_DN24037_c0_g1_i1.p1 TRINITY_DN24037_c0_g1~~TRINITY_DN24037_c0_g1_i1.p1  ORF type:complete len:327 (+),score=107.03 TRINITY_DN24037_c0_g1_i1:64-981(+)
MRPALRAALLRRRGGGRGCGGFAVDPEGVALAASVAALRRRSQQRREPPPPAAAQRSRSAPPTEPLPRDISLTKIGALPSLRRGAVPPESEARVLPDFVTPAEEAALLAAAEGAISARTWERAHADQLIEDFRELYVPLDSVKGEAAAPLARLADLARGELPEGGRLRADLHILEYRPEGYVRPHTDSEEDSGDIVVGLSLLSARVMTLTHPARPDAECEMLLLPRSVYVLRGGARTEWEHAIDWKHHLAAHRDPRLWFAGGGIAADDGPGEPLRRGRRFALLLRGQPRRRSLLRAMSEAATVHS